MGNKTIKIIICFFVTILFIAQANAQNISALQITKTSPIVGGSWGFILKKELEVTYREAVTNQSGNVDWWGAPTILVDVIGFGRHMLYYECNYTVYTFDVEHMHQPQTGIFSGNSSIYLFNLNMRPIIKIHVIDGAAITFFQFKNGSWTGRLFIDDILVSEKSFSYEHH